MRKLIIFAIAGLLAAQSTTITIKNEGPTPQPDGMRQFFSIKQVPIKWSTQLYLNGQRQTIGIDYGEYPATQRVGFFPCCIPQVGDRLVIDYDVLVPAAITVPKP